MKEIMSEEGEGGTGTVDRAAAAGNAADSAAAAAAAAAVVVASNGQFAAVAALSLHAVLEK